jgi:hypothetical protein
MNSHLETSTTIPQSTTNLEVCFNCHELEDPGVHGSCGNGHELIPLCHDCELKCPLCKLAARIARMFRLWNDTKERVANDTYATE